MMKRFKRMTAVFAAVCLLPGLTQAREPNSGQLLNQQKTLKQELEQKPSPTIELIEPNKPVKPAPQTQSNQTIKLQSVSFEGDAATLDQATLQSMAKPYIDKTINFGEIRQLNQKVSQYIKSQGYIVGFAYIPQQKVSDGVLTIKLQLGKLAKENSIVIHNKQQYLKDSIARQLVAEALKQANSAYIKQQPLERGMLLLNDLPGVSAKTKIQKGAAQGTSQLALDIKEAKRYQTSVFLDNYGNRYTGQGRVTAQLDINNPTGAGDAINLSASKTSENTQASIGYQRLLNSKGLTLDANASYLDYEIGKSFDALDAKGTAFNASVGLGYPIIRQKQKSLWAKAWLETRTLTSELLNEATQDKKLNLFTAAVYGNYQDRLGAGGINSIHAALSAGNVDLSDNAAALQADQATAKTQGAYQLLRLDLARYQYFDSPYSLHARFKAQYTNQNLDSSEQFFLGGPTGVRAYPVGEATGDRGYLLNLEARADTKWLKGSSQLQLVGFFDVGRIQLHTSPFAGGNNTATNENTYTLKGMGVGLNYQYQNKANIAVTLAKAIGSNPGRDTNGNNVDGKDQSTQLWVQAQLQF